MDTRSPIRRGSWQHWAVWIHGGLFGFGIGWLTAAAAFGVFH